MWRLKVASCKHTFNQFFWSCFEIIVAMELHVLVYTTSALSKLNSYSSHCMRAGSGECELAYSKDRCVCKLPQEKIIFPHYVSRHCHSIVATIEKPTQVHFIHKPCDFQFSCLIYSGPLKNSKWTTRCVRHLGDICQEIKSVLLIWYAEEYESEVRLLRTLWSPIACFRYRFSFLKQ